MLSSRRRRATIREYEERAEMRDMSERRGRPRRRRSESYTHDERSHWQLYNEQAAIYDFEKFKEWEDTISILLVFSALFSAILTAFIIESMKLLSREEVEAMRDILVTISHQLSNSSFPPHPDLTDFEAPGWAVRVNFLFICSLAINLVSSFLAVLALQWIRELDGGLTSAATPRDRALMHQFRLRGIKQFRFHLIFSVLPTGLLVALLLFMIGALIWFRQLSSSISWLLTGITIFMGSLFLGTALFAAISPSAPYRSPFSRFLRFLGTYLNEAVKWVSMVIDLTWNPHTIVQISHSHSHRHLRSGAGSREDYAIKTDPRLSTAAQMWLLDRIEVTSTSVNRILSILGTLLDEEPPAIVIEESANARIPWSSILSRISNHISTQLRVDHSTITTSMLARLLEFTIILGETAYSPELNELLSSLPNLYPDIQEASMRVIHQLALWRCNLIASNSLADPLGSFTEKMIGFADQVPPAILLRWLDTIEISPLRGNLSETLPLLRKLCTLCKQLFVHEFPLPAPSSQNAGTDVIRAVASTCLSLLRHVNPSRVSNFRVVRRPTTLNEILEATEIEAKECDSEAQSVTRDLGMLLVSLNLAQLQSRGDKQDETLEVIRSLRLPIFHEWAQDKQSIGFGFKPSQAPAKGALLDSHILFNMIQFDILENTHWGDELVDQLFALCHHIPGSVSRNTPEWWRAIEILETIAYCSGIDPPGELQRIRDLRASPASRMIQALIALSDVMASESTSLIISMGMGQHILRIFRVSLQSDKIEDLEDQVTRIGDPLLKWFANLLLGWEYSPDVFEDSSDPKWENGAWHIAISCWMQLLPPSRWSHDSHQLLFQLSQRDNQVILRTFHGCLREHIPMSKDTKEPLSEDLQGLLRVALPFFTDSQDLLQDSLIIIASVLNSYDCIDYFFDCGGLEWLCSMKRQYQPQETPDDSLEVTPVGPLQLFKDYIVNYIFRRDLIIEILRSPFIVEPTPDEDIHVLITITWEMLKVVSPIRRGEKFPAAATRCAEILNQELVIWSTRESSWSVSREIYETLGISYFEDWCRFVQDLIGSLRRDGSSITELGSAKMGLTASVNLWPVDD